MIWTKRFFCALVLLLNAASITQAADSSPSILRFHFIGTKQLVANTNAAKLKQIGNLPETTALQSNVLGKAATAASQLFGRTATENETLANRALIQPLLQDLLQYESILELRGNAQPGLNIALQLDNTRSAFWSSTLSTLCRAKDQKKETWSAQIAPGMLLHFGHKDKWTVVTIGSDTDGTQFNADLRKKEFSLQKNNWLQGYINWARLEKAVGISIPFKFSETEIAVTGKADDLFTTVQVQFPAKLEWKQEPWHIPSLVRDPLVSFTAAQPLAAFCKPAKLFEQTGFNPLTRQFYFWAYPSLPFQSFGAVHTLDATNEFKAFAPKLCTAANPLLAARNSGQYIVNATGSQLTWTNAQMMAPVLSPFTDSSGQFIVGSLFPSPPEKNPPPQALLSHVTSNPKLVYYDWEITQNRLGHWDMLTRILPVFSPEKLSASSTPMRVNRNAHSPAHVWIRAVTPLLGNTATEVTVTGSNELTLKRKSHIGFTGMELIYLSLLADEADFPLFGHKWQGIASSNTK